MVAPAIVIFLTCVLIIFAYCFHGDRATKDNEDLADRSYETNWYKLPTQTQKYILIMMINAQRPEYYHGMGLVNLNLIVFAKVLKYLSYSESKPNIKFHVNV